MRGGVNLSVNNAIFRGGKCEGFAPVWQVVKQVDVRLCANVLFEKLLRERSMCDANFYNK